MQQTINKKFNILQELQQAIKRKAIDKQRSREHTNKQLLLSIDKRRAQSKSVHNKERGSDVKERRTPSKEETYVMKPFLMNNENLRLTETIEKKGLGKRVDKLLSLMNYTISSAEKAIKFVNTANFEAEFAVKLFKSDRDALQMEIELFIKTQEEYSRQSPLDSVKATTGNLTNLENHSLKNENSTLRKQNLIAQAQINKLKEEKTLLATELKNLKGLLSVQDKKERLRIKDKEKQIDHLLKEIHDIDELKRVDKGKQSILKHNLFLKEKEEQKLKSLMRDCYPLDSLEKYFDLLEKQTKFHMMLYSNYDNQKKKNELELIIKSLEVERQTYEKKLQPIDYKQNIRNTQLKNYIRQRILPMLEDRQAQEMSEIEMIECWMREKSRKGSRVSQRQIQLENELATLNNQIEILKIQNSKDKSEEYKRLTKDKELLQANLQEIYDDLRNICLSNNLVDNDDENQIDFQKIITSIKQFVEESQVRQKTVAQDHQKTIMAIELAAERKSNKDKSKFIEELQVENDRLLARTVELEDDLGKLTKKIDKMEKQIQQQDRVIQKNKKEAISVSANNQKINQLEAELSRSEHQKTGVIESNNDLKRQVYNLQSQIEKKDRSIKSFEDAMQQMKKSQDFLKLQLQKAKNMKTTAEESLNSQLQQYRVRIGELQAQIPKNSMKDEIRQLEEQILRLGKIIKTQQQSILQLQQDKTKLAEELNIEAEQSELRIQKLKQSEERRIRLERDLKEALAARKDDSAQSDNEYAGKLEKELAYTEKQLSEQRDKFKKLTIEWNHLKVDSDEKEKVLQEQIQQLKHKLSIGEEELSNAKRQLQLLQNQQAQYAEKQNEELKTKLVQLQLQLTNYVENSTIVEELQSKINELEQQIIDEQEKSRIKHDQLEQIQRQLLQTQEKYQNLQQTLRQRQKNYDDSQETVKKLEQILKETQNSQHNAADFIEQKLRNTEKQLMDTKSLYIQAVVEAKLMQQSNSNQQTIVKQLNQQILQLRQKITKLNEQINNKQNELDSVSSQLAAKNTEIEHITEQRNGHVQMLRNYMEESKQDNQIRQMKNKQYAALIKKIIKKIVELDGLEDEDDLDRLLEQGTKKVFDWHRTREWQSSQKPTKEEVVVEKVEPFRELEDVPVRIPKLEEKKVDEKKVDEKQERRVEKQEEKGINKFESIGAQLQPQQTKEAVPIQRTEAIDDIDDFQDFQQKSMNASMMSVEAEPKLQPVVKQSQAIDLQDLDEYHTEQQKIEPVKQNHIQNQQLLAEDQFQDFKQDSMNSSMMSNKGFAEPIKAPAETVRSEEKQERVKTDPMAADFDQFGSFHDESMSKSGIAENQFDDFPDQLQRALDSSMISNDPRQPVNVGNIHNILQGQNIEAVDQEDKHDSFKDFLDNEFK